MDNFQFVISEIGIVIIDVCLYW